MQKPLERIVVGSPAIPSSLSPDQLARLQFYRSLIQLIRDSGGAVNVCTVNDQPVAVSCWLPPGIRPTFISLWSSGLLGALFRLGLKSPYRLWYFQHLMDYLYTTGLMERGWAQQDGAYVETLATDPEQAGHGYGTGLLRWQIERHQEQFPSTPVFLDTNSDYAQKVYKRLGFVEINRRALEADINEYGCREKSIGSKSSARNAPLHEFRVMMLDRILL